MRKLRETINFSKSKSNLNDLTKVGGQGEKSEKENKEEVKEHTSTVEKRGKKVGRDEENERKIKRQTVKQKDKERKMKAVPFFPLSLLYTFFCRDCTQLFAGAAGMGSCQRHT